ncbi:MAG: hypothetical protein FJ214_02775 [Ignavibacteria bacterium]|nr:hypothetical protein [Ignavibacteria bacterium]
MKKTMNFILILSLISVVNFSQTRIGIKYEPFLMKSRFISNTFLESGTRNQIFLSSVYVSYSSVISRDLFFTIRPGILLTWDHSQYNGLEIYIAGEYFFNKKIYLICGITVHDNWRKISSTNVNHPINDTFYLLISGIGFYLSDKIPFEIQCLVPTKKKIGHELLIALNPIELDYLIKISIGFEWEI